MLRFLRVRLAKRAPADPWDALRSQGLLADDHETGENRRWKDGFPVMTRQDLLDLGFDPKTATIDMTNETMSPRGNRLAFVIQEIADSIHYRPLLSALNVKVIREASLSQLSMDLAGFTDEEVEFALAKFKKAKGIS